MELLRVTPDKRILIEAFMSPAFYFSPDWTGLMPVVEKISKIGYDVEIYASGLNENHECHIHDTGNSYACIEDGSSLLNATYKAVVAFIEWHNTKQQAQKQPLSGSNE